MRCDQCGRPAVFDFGGHPLCIDHWAIVERIEHQRLLALERAENQTRINIAEAMGDPGSLALALAERETMAQRVTNVNVANSIVGAINTGTIRNLTVKMEKLSQGSSADVASAFKALADAVLASSTLSPEVREETASQLEFLVDQASAPTQRRSPALIRPVLQALGITLSTTADILEVWNTWGQSIRSFFGL